MTETSTRFARGGLQAKVELRSRLIALNGTTNGYVKRIVELVPVASGDDGTVGEEFVSMTLNGRRPTPIWLAIAYIRIVNENYTMDRDDALAQVGEWFTTEGVQ